MIEKHRVASPDTCDVCKYAVEHGLDVLMEHTMVNAAALYLTEDLRESPTGYLSLGAIAVDAIGFEPGPVHNFAPQHWYFGLVTERSIMLSLRSPGEGVAQ